MSTRVNRTRAVLRGLLGLLTLLAATATLPAAELQILLPLTRTAYQTNEWIDVSVVRQGTQNLSAGDLVVQAVGDDGSKLSFTFAVPAVQAVNNKAQRTEHLHLNGALLRPGHYTVEVHADAASAHTTLDVFSHVRKSDFKLVDWGRAAKGQELDEGEDNLGFNLFYGNPGNGNLNDLIRAGCDFMSNCTMSGAHQMDIRLECDWSDPYVTRGGTRRVVRRAFEDRTRPNVLGVHFYDEPGLTWLKNPVTGENSPHEIPSQVRAYKNAFGKEPLPSYQLKPGNAEQEAQWRQWALWKLGFMDAAWKEASFGVSYVRPDYLSVTQSQYGWSAFTDGYYFNVVRSLPVISGHGGYDDYGLDYFNPSYTLEMARARDFSKPCWYLPTWYGNTPSERFRLEQYLSFMTNIQGMTTPPDIDPFDPASKPAAEGVVESNKLMGHLGTIFTQMPVTRPPVAMLYSMWQNIHDQAQDVREMNYAQASRQGQHLPFTYLAGKLLQQQFLAVLDEDIIDGTLAAHHKAVILTGLDSLDPRVQAALEDFVAQGGLVLLTGDCKVQIKGAVNLGVTAEFPDAEIIRKLNAEKKYPEAAKYQTVGKWVEGTMPLAKAIKAQLDKAGIKPVFVCDQPGITATRQAAGDIEYLFAVNATYDEMAGTSNAQRAATANILLEGDGRPVYDAVHGGAVAELKKQEQGLGGKFRFGPGEMRVFARTARPIGKVQALTPQVQRDYTRYDAPLTVDVGGTLLDDQGRVLAGAAPLQVRVLDALGKTRYDLYRATKDGTLRLTLPLAANDPPGPWQVVVRELLNNTEDRVTFQLRAPTQCGTLAGASDRAVSFGHDRDNVFRFFRVHHDVKIVVGTSDYEQDAARRVTEVLRPWGVRCQVVKAADVNHPRPVSDEEAPTLVGLDPGRAQAGKNNGLTIAGFDIEGPVVLLGNPTDNPLIQFIAQQRFLPYQPDPSNFPGHGRGMVAWQRDAIGAGQDSITLIAYDAAGLNEAVGSLDEAVSGLEPLTPYVLPRLNQVTAATKADLDHEAPIAWQVTLPDRALAMKAADGRVNVVTWDGSRVQVDANGKVVKEESVEPGDIQKAAKELETQQDEEAVKVGKKHAGPGQIVKKAVAHEGRVAVAYWGGTVKVLDANGAVETSQLLPQDVAGLAWLNGKVVVGLADGRLVALGTR